MMSEKQYKVALGGVMEQIKLAQRLRCPRMEARHKAALAKLQRKYLKPDSQEVFAGGRIVINHYYVH